MRREGSGTDGGDQQGNKKQKTWVFLGVFVMPVDLMCLHRRSPGLPLPMVTVGTEVLFPP
jgi:hypothetical protein